MKVYSQLFMSVCALLHTAHSVVIDRNVFTSLLRCLVVCAMELVYLHYISLYCRISYFKLTASVHPD